MINHVLDVIATILRRAPNALKGRLHLAPDRSIRAPVHRERLLFFLGVEAMTETRGSNNV